MSSTITAVLYIQTYGFQRKGRKVIEESSLWTSGENDFPPLRPQTWRLCQAEQAGGGDIWGCLQGLQTLCLSIGFLTFWGLNSGTKQENRWNCGNEEDQTRVWGWRGKSDEKHWAWFNWLIWFSGSLDCNKRNSSVKRAAAPQHSKPEGYSDAGVSWADVFSF